MSHSAQKELKRAVYGYSVLYPPSEHRKDGAQAGISLP